MLSKPDDPLRPLTAHEGARRDSAARRAPSSAGSTCRRTRGARTGGPTTPATACGAGRGAAHAPRETVEVPTTKGPAPDLRESGRKCECVWLCRGGEWRIEYPCEGHAKEPKKKRDARQRERNEHGWA